MEFNQKVKMENRRSKKCMSKKNNLFGNWINETQCDQSNEVMKMSSMECPQIVWQPGMQPHVQNHNGQRLFATMSDPSICGYSPMPMTYTMEPVSLPTVYRLYQPMPYSVQAVHGRSKQKFHPNPPVIPDKYNSLQENKTNSTETSSEHRRYSDPGLGPKKHPHNQGENSGESQGEDSDSEDSGSSTPTIGRSNKLILSLIEQIRLLFKELGKAKSEIETMKMKLSEREQSSDYQPGMLSDLIREIREANKVFEEGLMTKVQCMVEEKHNRKDCACSAEIGLLKGQVLELRKEREKSDRRVSKLKAEVTELISKANNSGRDLSPFEQELENMKLFDLQEAGITTNHHQQEQSSDDGTGCVNAVSRSVTPVIFEAPRITSTPVRTAITETTYNLAPVITSTIPTTSNEFALVNHAEDNEKNEDEDDSFKFHAHDGKETVSVALTLDKVINDALESMKENRRNERIDRADKKLPEEAHGVQRRGSSSRRSCRKRPVLRKKKKNYQKDDDNEDDNEDQLDSADPENSFLRTIDDRSIKGDREEDFDHSTRCPNNDEIVDHVDGGSFAKKIIDNSKDLFCSNKGILTSRVLTAPSRVTYTTAYI